MTPLKMTLLKAVITLTQTSEIDPALVAAVVSVESNFKPTATGAIGERGLMQLHPKYFPNPELYDPQLNLETGIKHLTNIKKRCMLFLPNEDTWIICHNRGVAGAKKVEEPLNDEYYKKIKAAKSRYADIIQSSDVLGQAIFKSGEDFGAIHKDRTNRSPAIQRTPCENGRPLHQERADRQIYDSRKTEGAERLPTPLPSYRDSGTRACTR